ncbi:alkyl sulfatase C-terminal domain-containing protein [Ktedonospora formicarum]|uniref:Alkyl sulfatase C-terminal domain-containing protein n=1 Tax=Ktedonospora formicarum TaxID=2778364 RepID=A0A8J3MRE3_9CHLR|nr:alkyl sulfatase C-terminal domain-containing protein [Ktedonospora formicarum]GHO45927.1 hypothetical protein KSX_40900 [Ktedonospora formicarum]
MSSQRCSCNGSIFAKAAVGKGTPFHPPVFHTWVFKGTTQWPKGRQQTNHAQSPVLRYACVLVLANGALNHTLGEQRADADATLSLSRSTLNKIIMGESSLKREIDTGEANVHGKKEAFHEMFSLLDTFEFGFNIITP